MGIARENFFCSGPVSGCVYLYVYLQHHQGALLIPMMFLFCEGSEARECNVTGKQPLSLTVSLSLKVWVIYLHKCHKTDTTQTWCLALQHQCNCCKLPPVVHHVFVKPHWVQHSHSSNVFNSMRCPWNKSKHCGNV